MKISTVSTCLTCICLLGACSKLNAEIARGTVFDDRNGNGVRDANEPGLALIGVSNGLDVVQTGDAGHYKLSVDDDAILFVIKPRGWRTASDKLNLQRFYYNHKPAGSPDEKFVYPGVEPTGPLPDAIDFPLTASPEPDKFTVIMMGDPQPYSRQEVRFYANDVIAELIDTPAAFGISMGDIVGDKLSLFGSVNEVQALVGVPWYNVLGNHDINYRSPNDKYSDETFESVYGPANYAFQYGPVHFVVLDNVFWKGPARKDKQGNRLGGYEGRLTDHQVQFVANYLATVPKDQRVVICVHIPLPELYENTQHSTRGLSELLEVLSSHPYTLSFSAHTHINSHQFLGKEEGYSHEQGDGHHHHHNVATGSGSWYRGPLDEQGFPVTTMADGAPNGYILATFDGNDYSVRYKAARMPAGYQMSIFTPDVIEAKQSGTTEVVVNVFNGTEKSKVRMRVRGHGTWLPMLQSPRVDPMYAIAQVRDKKNVEDSDVKRAVLPRPRKTAHIWAAHLPPNLPVGFHVLEVESTDMFGTIDQAVRLIEVE